MSDTTLDDTLELDTFVLLTTVAPHYLPIQNEPQVLVEQISKPHQSISETQFIQIIISFIC